MSADDATLEEPPAYDEPDTWPPVVLVLAGQSIHAESANTAVLYRLNRGVASLTHSTSEVELERVHQTVRAGSSASNDPEPNIKIHTRHIYTLKHMRSMGLIVLPSDAPRFYIEAVSRRHEALGDIGLKQARFCSSRWTALPVDVSGRNSSLRLPQFVEGQKPMFAVRREKDGKHRWTDGTGKDVAVEDEGEGQHRLVVSVSLSRETMDALVALWCVRLWQYSAEHAEGLHEGMEGGMSPSFAARFQTYWC